MSPTSGDRLQRLLGGRELASLRARLRRRFERADPDATVAAFRIDRLTPEEHAALVSLIGRSPRFSNSLELDLGLIDGALRRAGIAASLHDALERLDGPIVNIATARNRSEAIWSEVTDRCNHPRLHQFLGQPSGLRLLKRLSGQNPDIATGLRDRAEAVLCRLPAKGVPRAQLAAEVIGDAHALDNGQATAALVLAVWRRVVAPPRFGAAETSLEETDGAGTGLEMRDERTRDIWARAGVLVNELARPAMFLNLPTSGVSGQMPTPGEPGYLSLRVLLRSPPAWSVEGRDVFVSENPNLVAIAADQLGSRSAPLVCSDGMPAAAQQTLLIQLARAGASLRYHGDFDWAGLRIANYVMRELGAAPWRLGASDYEAAVRTAPRPGHRLDGPEVIAAWDETLMPAMRVHGLAIAEEGAAALLLEDLATG